MTDERRYDEREVGLILKRVAELHEHGGDKADARSMTRAEIEQVVTELGISKALVVRAASELSVQDLRNRPVWWLGGKTDVMFEDRVEGEVGQAQLTRMVEVLRRSLGDPGTLETQGDSRIWTTTDATRRVHLSLVRHEEHTTIRLEERMPVDSRVTVGGSALGGGLLGFLLAVPLKALVSKAALMIAMGPATAIGATLGWLVGRAVWKRRSRGRDDQLGRAFGEILEIASAEPKALPESRSEPRSAP